MQQLPLGVRVGEAARFDGFVVGSNAEILGLLTAAVPPRALWLWGRRGTGKSHLLQADRPTAAENKSAITSYQVLH